MKEKSLTNSCISEHQHNIVRTLHSLCKACSHQDELAVAGVLSYLANNKISFDIKLLNVIQQQYDPALEWHQSPSLYSTFPTYSIRNKVAEKAAYDSIGSKVNMQQQLSYTSDLTKLSELLVRNNISPCKRNFSPDKENPYVSKRETEVVQELLQQEEQRVSYKNSPLKEHCRLAMVEQEIQQEKPLRLQIMKDIPQQVRYYHQQEKQFAGQDGIPFVKSDGEW